MSNLTRRGGRETLSLREAMDRLLADSFVRFGEFPFSSGNEPAPLLNVRETSEAVIVEAALPGIKPDDLNVSITGDVLTIKGEMRHEQQQGTYHRQEWHYASFERSVSLPVQIDADRAQSAYQNGVLTLTLPKTEAVKPRRVQIKAHTG